MPTQSVSPTIEDFIRFANKLPDIRKIYYELDLTNYAAKNLGEEDYETILSWLKENTIKGYIEEKNKNLLFAAFFLLTIYSRRMKNFSDYSRLINDFGEFFEEEPLYPHVLALYHKHFNSSDHMEWTIDYARQAVQNLPAQIGVLHNYIEAIVTAKENKLEIADSLWEDAQQKMTEVSKHNLYAKFNCTRGRLLALLGNFSEAKQAIHRAIDQEVSTSKDYAMRINEYQSQLIRIQTLETSSIILSQLENTKEEIERSKKEMKVSMEKLQNNNIQFLGFFVAIITLTIGSFNLISEKSFLDTALLILVLTGCIILGYVSLGFILQPKNSNNFYQIIVLIISILLIIGSILAHFLEIQLQ